MYRLGVEIRIGDKTFKRVNEVQVESDLRKIEDRATIKLPATARLERQGEYVSEVETAKAFTVGDEVTIELGYDGELREEFRGFVSRIRPNIPLEIECEDEIFLLKRKNLKRSFIAATLKQLLQFIVDGTGIELAPNVPEITFDVFVFDDVSAAKALQKIKDNYGLQMYFTGWKTLYVGIRSDNDGQVVKYQMGYNVISSSLEWAEESDVKLKVKAVLVRPDNTQVEKTLGDPDGELRTLFFYDLKDEKTLAQRAQEELLKYRFAGYRGEFITFLLPNAQVGNVARIQDPQFEERAGDYIIESIKTTFGSGGARRIIKPGLKVD